MVSGGQYCPTLDWVIDLDLDLDLGESMTQVIINYRRECGLFNGRRTQFQRSINEKNRSMLGMFRFFNHRLSNQLKTGFTALHHV